MNAQTRVSLPFVHDTGLWTVVFWRPGSGIRGSLTAPAHVMLPLLYQWRRLIVDTIPKGILTV